MTETERSDRNRQIVAYFAKNCDDGDLGRTRLMKLVYLADYEARRFFGEPLSSFEYRWHHYGPWDQSFRDLAKEMVEKDEIVCERVIYSNGKSGYLYSAGPNAPMSTLDPAEIEILAYVRREYMRYGLRELLDDVVYETEPMVKAREDDARGEVLQMDIANNLRRNELGVDFRDILERVRRVRSGDSIPHVDAMAALTPS